MRTETGVERAGMEVTASGLGYTRSVSAVSFIQTLLFHTLGHSNIALISVAG